MFGSRICLLCFLTTLFWAGTTKAEIFYPLISYQCNTSANIVRITNKLLPSEDGKNFAYSDADGTYSPWHMVDIENINGTPIVTHKRKIVKTCKLSSGEYIITLEPQVFTRDLTGHCGDSISAAVTVEFDGIDIQERLPFEDFCLGNAPVITQVTVFGKTSEVKLKRIPKYKFY